MKNNSSQANGINNVSFQIYSDGKRYSSLLNSEWLELHKLGYLHIHDLEYTGISHNCIGINLKTLLEKKFSRFMENLKTSDLMDEMLEIFLTLSNEQSGGIGIMNIDEDLAPYVENISHEELTSEFRSFFKRLNLNLRKGFEKAYITFNMGLNTENGGRKVTSSMLKAFQEGEPLTGVPFLFPNLVFKIKDGINRKDGDLNYDLLQLAAEVSSTRMNPTYYNCDILEKSHIPSNLQGIMGCRTLLGSNRHGRSGGEFRGNIAALSLNLPKIASESQSREEFFEKLDSLSEISREILMERYRLLCNLSLENFRYIRKNGFYLNSDSTDTEGMLKNGTLSLGFIGVFDALAKLEKSSIDITFVKNHMGEAEEILKFMRDKTDMWSEKYQVNFSLLASSGEGISGKFAKDDPENEFYTNSFHLPVYCNTGIFEKISLESKLSQYCNGGSISYVELSAQASGNPQSILDIVEYGMMSGCTYLGVNFKLDICNCCTHEGSFKDENCPNCTSEDIVKIRRVSGYLSNKDSFKLGKREEELARIAHL